MKYLRSATSIMRETLIAVSLLIAFGISACSPNSTAGNVNNGTGPSNTNVDTTRGTDRTVNSNVDVQNEKKYSEMTEAEKTKYVERTAMQISRRLGNNNNTAIPTQAVERIKAYVDSYAKRSDVKPVEGCRFGDNLQATYERASKIAPDIIKAFNEKNIDPLVGLYLAMIESEYCVCLQSPTGPLGLFQFTRAMAEKHGLKVTAVASPSDPDERCQPEKAAGAAASYFKEIELKYGPGPLSLPLSIGSYNSGEAGLSRKLEKALSDNSGLTRDYWTLVSDNEMLSKQFQAENFKYVPKFFAAAIVGEDPQDFGLSLQPLSSYKQ